MFAQIAVLKWLVLQLKFFLKILESKRSKSELIIVLWNEADEKEIITKDLNTKIQFLIEKYELEQRELITALEMLYKFFNDSFSMGVLPISESEFEIEMMNKVDSIINKYK